MKRYTAVLMILVLITMNTIIVHGESRPAARAIPDKTLIVGTHLISVDALNGEILKIAAATAEKTGQDKVYFKSDINKGAWYDITDGGNITRIAITTDNLVTEEEIDALTLTHYTKPNGQTVEFATGKIVSVNSIEGINFPPNLPELEEVAKEAEILYSILEELNEDDGGREVYERSYASAAWVLALIDDSVFRDYTARLNNLDSFISFLRGAKNASSAIVELVVAEKQFISAERELYVYSVVEGKINAQFDALDYREYSAIIDKYSAALTNMQAHMLELTAQLKGEPVNSLERVYQKYSNMMLAAVSSGSGGYESAYVFLLNMNAINNLRFEVIEDRALEIEMAREIKKDVLTKLAGESGGSRDYNRAVRNGERRDVLEKLKLDGAAQFLLYTDELNAASGYIVMRTDSESGKAAEAIELREGYASLLDSMPESDMKDVISDALSKELETASENADSLKMEASDEYSAAKSEVERLTDEVKGLNESYIGAVEESDMGAAEDIKQQLNRAAANLAAAERRLEEIGAQVKAQEDFALNANVRSGFENALEDAKGLRERLNDFISAYGGGDGDTGADPYDEETAESLSEIINEINDLGNTSIAADSTAEEAAAALDGIMDTLTQSDFDGQVRALNKALNNASAKIAGSEKLKSNKSAQTAKDAMDDMRKELQSLLNAPATPENTNKLDNMKSAFEEMAKELNEAAASSPSQPVNIPPEAEAEIAAIAEDAEGQNPIVSGHMSSYSEAEKSEARSAMQSAMGELVGTSSGDGSGGRDATVIEPWRLIFTDYNVKLRSPVITFGQELYVPARELAEQLGSAVMWDKAARRGVIKDRGVLIEFREGDNFVHINDRKETVKTGVQNISGRLYIPLSSFEKAYRLVRAEEDGAVIVSKR